VVFRAQLPERWKARSMARPRVPSGVEPKTALPPTKRKCRHWRRPGQSKHQSRQIQSRRLPSLRPSPSRSGRPSRHRHRHDRGRLRETRRNSASAMNSGSRVSCSWATRPTSRSPFICVFGTKSRARLRTPARCHPVAGVAPGVSTRPAASSTATTGSPASSARRHRTTSPAVRPRSPPPRAGHRRPLHPEPRTAACRARRRPGRRGRQQHEKHGEATADASRSPRARHRRRAEHRQRGFELRRRRGQRGRYPAARGAATTAPPAARRVTATSSAHLEPGIGAGRLSRWRSSVRCTAGAEPAPVPPCARRSTTSRRAPTGSPDPTWRASCLQRVPDNLHAS
jgi:hypothetical protein